MISLFKGASLQMKKNQTEIKEISIQMHLCSLIHLIEYRKFKATLQAVKSKLLQINHKIRILKMMIL